MKSSSTNQKVTACLQFEAELSAFIDNELDELHVQKVVSHLENCKACRLRVERMRICVKMHQDCYDEEALLASLDGQEMFGGLTSAILVENIDRIAGLFYEIGKAFVVKGSRDRRKFLQLKAHLLTKPIAIGNGKSEARNILEQTGDLSRINTEYEKVVNRASSFFRKVSRDSNEYVAIGRRFLEESLSIDGSRAEPRIYLGYSYIISKRYDLAQTQLRNVLAMPGVSEKNRMIVFQNLGFIATYKMDYYGAIDCYQEIVKSGFIEKNPNFYRVLRSLALSYAKVSNFEKSTEFFNRIVEDFPERVKEVRKDLCSMGNFQKLLHKQQLFHEDLQERVPELFSN